MGQEEKKGFFANLADKASLKMDEIQLKDAISKSFEMQATEFQNVEVKFLIAKKFFGVYNPRRQQIRFRIEDKVEEHEIYQKVSDSHDEQKYVIKSITRDNVRDYIIRVKEVSYPIKCYLATVEVV